MERQTVSSKGKPALEDWIFHLQALALARAGRLEAARQSARHAIDLAVAGGNARTSSGVGNGRGRVGSVVPATRRGKTERHARARGRERSARHVRCGIGAGDCRRAFAGGQAIADDLERRFPEDTSVRFSYLPTLRALSALGANDPSRRHRAAAAGRHLRVRATGDLVLRGRRRFVRCDVSDLPSGPGVSGATQGRGGGRRISEEFSITPASCSRTRNRLARTAAARTGWTLSGRQGQGGALPTRISSRFGKPQRLTSRFSSRVEQSTPSCSKSSV